MINLAKKIKRNYIKILVNFQAKRRRGWIVKWIDSLDLNLLLNLDSYIDFCIDIRGQYDIETLETMSSFIGRLQANKKDSWLIDIGSNIGLMSLYLKKKHNYLKVHAFEPVSANFHQNKMNQIINNIDYDLNQVILGSQIKNDVEIFLNDESIEVEFQKYNFGMASIYKNRYRTGARFEKQDMTTFDNFIVSKNMLADLHNSNIFIKIDVEGAEFEVIEGMKLFLNEIKSSTVVFFVELLFAETQNNCKKFASFLNKYGYTMMTYSETKISLNEVKKLKSGNYIFIKED